MKSHLNIRTNKGKELTLSDNFSIDIEDANPLFNENEMHSLPVSVPIEGNRHLLENIEDIRSDFGLKNIDHLPMKVYVDGIPFRTGVAVMDETQELKDEISFCVNSSQLSLNDMIADLKCRDVPVKDKILIGEMVGNVDVKWSYYYQTRLHFKEGHMKVRIYGDKNGNPLQDVVQQHFDLQALGFSYPFSCVEAGLPGHIAERKEGKVWKLDNYVNVSKAYPDMPYCNTRICYNHANKEDDGSSGSGTLNTGEYGPFYVLEADRPQTGVNFYVLYFLDCLFHYLNVSYSSENLMKVEDMKHLFFFNTACKYDLVRKYNNAARDFNSLTEINEWVSSRATDASHCGQLTFVEEKKRELDSIVYMGMLFRKGETVNTPSSLYPFLPKHLTLDGCYNELIQSPQNYHSVQADIMQMYANAENFPDENVSTILESMWNSFGIKFIMNEETHAVRPIFIRDIFRDTSEPIDIPCRIISVRKMTEKITGVRMTYSAESDPDEQKDNIKYGVTDYDTNFDYTDYSLYNDRLTYAEILQKKSCTDRTAYIDRSTGNAYRIKVDKDASKMSEMNARLFEVGGYKGVEIGDCSPINEDYVEDLSISWSPMLFTDINLKKEMAVRDNGTTPCMDENGNVVEVGGANTGSKHQIMAAFFDEEMWHENTKFCIDNAVSGEYCDAYLREVITTDESYDPTETDDGNSPLQSADWGVTVGLMRGGGSNATIQQYDYDYDGCGSSKWRMVAGRYDSTSDSIDNWGNVYDYNGNKEGIGDGERISMKIRSFKQDPKTGEALCNDLPDVKNRGLFDKFMSEYTHFLLHRKIYKITCECEIAVLADIPNHWERRFRIGNMVGWINKINSSVSVKDGLDVVEIEFYTL